MSKHNETGLKGEKIAEKFLVENGFQILHKNWCFGKKEIDLIALKDGLLVFVEVKTRSGFHFGYPEEAVNLKKQHNLKTAAEAFLEEYVNFAKIRFDIISILLEKENALEILHLEDAFY